MKWNVFQKGFIKKSGGLLLCSGVWLLMISGCGTPMPTLPTANAGPDQNVSLGASVTLDGSGSTSSTGSPLSFAWTQTGGTAVTLAGANTATPTFTAPNEPGTLTFQLIVSDENGESTPDTVSIRVGEPASTPPTANAGPDQNVLAGASVTLNGAEVTSSTQQVRFYLHMDRRLGEQRSLWTGADTALRLSRLRMKRVHILSS